MKLLRLIIVFLLLGALLHTNALTASSDDLTLLDESDDEDTDDESKTEDEEEEDDETKTEDEEDDEDEKEEKENAHERELKIEQSDKEFKVESELKNGENKDKIEIEFKVEDKAEIKLKYKSKSADLEAKFKYRVSFEKIVEYYDPDQTGFNEDRDVLSEYKFKEWDAIQYDESTVNGVVVYTINATTADGVFTLILKFSTAVLALGDATLTPNSVKIDVIINNYEYTQTDSSLAVKAKIKTESKLEIEDESVEESEGIVEGETQVGVGLLSAGFFSWANTAIADGLTIDVLSSTLEESTHEDDDLEENETSKKLYFSFITTNANNIVWDPKVGVISESTQQLVQSIEDRYAGAGSDGSSLPGFGIWMLLLSVSTLYAIYNKKRTQIRR